jgi:hypothetical protein
MCSKETTKKRAFAISPHKNAKYQIKEEKRVCICKVFSGIANQSARQHKIVRKNNKNTNRGGIFDAAAIEKGSDTRENFLMRRIRRVEWYQ